MPAAAAPRVMFYVQHLLGIGHLARASAVARALMEDGFDVTLVTGGKPVAGFPGPGLRHVALPALAVSDGAFAGLVDAAGRPVDQAFMDARSRLLQEAFHTARPDIVITEAFPFGRRQVRFELLPLIDTLEATQPRPKLVASLRDILQRSAKPGRDAETVAMVRAHYDLVLVHGDPAFATLPDTFPLAHEIAERIRYTGIVCAAPPPPATERFEVVVSAGGGAVGAGLVQAALGAAALLPEIASWCIIAGPNLPEADFARAAAAAPPHVRLERFRTDFRSLLGVARLSVSQAGYNTVGDVLQAGCRALLVPYAADGETEQSDRALRLQAAGRAVVLEEAGLGAAAMAGAIRAALAGEPGVGALQGLAIDGARRTAAILRDLISQYRVTGL